MDTRVVVAIIAVIAVVLIVAAVIITQRRKSERLKQQFGPEYDRTVKLQGDSRHAEAVLAQREKRVEKLSIRPLPPVDRERYVEQWAVLQRRFVDDPSTAVAQADTLVTTVMNARGYPMGDFDQRAADISVHHPVVVQNYRAAHEIALRHSEGKSSTEDLRKAMVYYRSLFDELLDTNKPHVVGASHERLAS
jgi:hypothetical protein